MSNKAERPLENLQTVLKTNRVEVPKRLASGRR
jgi:hypothetical protein